MLDKTAVLELTAALAHNDEVPRLRAFDRVRRLLPQGLISKEFYGHVWQGLYVCLWHSDTMVKQAKLSQEMVALVLPDLDSFFEWNKLGLIVLRKHWNELDFFRVNKFMYLVRLILQECFKKIEENNFKKSVFSLFNSAVVSTTLLNDEILERGFILHIIHIYPEIATVANYPSVTEMFFGIKPLFDLLTFTEVKVIRENIRERLGDIWVPFCTTQLTSTAQEYIKDKLMNFASADGVPVPNRKKLYDILESLGDSSEPPASEKPLLDIKVPGAIKRAAQPAAEVISETNGAANTHASSSQSGLKAKPAGQVAKASKLKLNQSVKETKALNQAVAEHLDTTSLTTNMIVEDTNTVSVSASIDLSESKPAKLNKAEKKAKARAAAQEQPQQSSSSAEGFPGKHVLESILSGKPLDEIYKQIGVTEEEYDLPEDLDMSGLTYEQLRQKLPAYMFMTGKRRVKYFKKIMTDYQAKLKEQPPVEKTQRVQFDKQAPVSQVKSSLLFDKVFNKKHKVAPPGTRVESKGASPKILKRPTAVEASAAD